MTYDLQNDAQSWTEDERNLNYPNITDRMTSGATGCDHRVLLGRQVVATHPVVDSDREEFLLLFSDGTSALFSCDPGYMKDDCTRDPNRWESYIADASETEAGEALRTIYADRLK